METRNDEVVIGGVKHVNGGCTLDNPGFELDIASEEVKISIQDGKSYKLNGKEELQIDSVDNQSDDSADEESNTNVNAKIHLVWKDLCVDAVLRPPSCISRLRSCCCKNNSVVRLEKKPILKNVSGDAKPGSLLAIMGASGAGKTTLLNVLSYQNREGLSIKGSILVNNRNIKRKMKSLSAYVQQEDLFIGTLTVKEHLTFQALLRLDNTYTKKEKKQRVMDVMGELGLLKCQDTIIGVPGRIRGISGGELKRLSFASEIITNPKLLYVDEPTSGLDSFMAESCIRALQKLARKGRTICATIHQPSSGTFQLFDRLFLLSEGRVAFQGSTTEAVDFFMGVGFPCPTNYNPADHYIHTLAIIPGDEEECRRKAAMVCDEFDKMGCKTSEGDLLAEETDALPPVITKHHYLQGFGTQLKNVTWRAWQASSREPLMNKVRIIQAVIISLLIGLIFLNQPNSQAGITNINGVMFFLIISMSFGGVNGVVALFPAQLPVFLKEHRMKMYRVDAYFIGRQLAELPWHLFTVTLQVTIVYWMAGLLGTAKNFFIFLGIVQMTMQCGYSFGLMISALSPTTQIAVMLAAPLTLPFMLFGGFFLKDRSIPVYFIWLKYLAWMRYAFQLCEINQWADFGKIGCADNSTSCFPDGMAVLKSNGYNPDDFNESIGVFFALIIGFRLLAFLALLFRARGK